MIRINVNLKDLTDLHTTLVSTHDKMTTTNNQIYSNLSKLNNMWNDPNTSVFLNQLIVDEEAIDKYTNSTKQTCDTILEFINDLVNVAIRCNCVSNSNFNYNSDNANSLINYCNSAQKLIVRAINQLSSMDIPGSFRYASALYNMKAKLSDINEQLVTDINDLNEVVHLTNTAYNKIKSFPVSEPLILKPLTYISNSQNVSLTSSKGLIDDSLSKQNLNAHASSVDYKEEATNFNNTSVNQMANTKTVNYDENNISFVNAANQKTAIGSSLTFDEQKNGFQNTSVNQAVASQQNNFEANETLFQNSSIAQNAKAVENTFENNNTSFISSSSETTPNQNTINTSNENYHINGSQNQTVNNSNNDFQMSNNNVINNSKEAQTNTNNIEFSKATNNLNASKEYNTSSNNLDFNINNNFESNHQTYDTTNNNLDFNINSQFENTAKEFNVDDIDTNLR